MESLALKTNKLIIISLRGECYNRGSRKVNELNEGENAKCGKVLREEAKTQKANFLFFIVFPKINPPSLMQGSCSSLDPQPPEKAGWAKG